MTPPPRSLIALSALLLCAAGTATFAAEAKPCLTAPELRATIAAIAPGAIRAATKRCRARLPANAYLATAATAAAERLRPAALAALPAARSGLERMAGTQLPMSFGGEIVLALIDAGIAEGIGERIKPEDCARVDRLLAAADPLPPANFVDLVAAVAELGLADGSGDIRLCPVASRP